MWLHGSSSSFPYSSSTIPSSRRRRQRRRGWGGNLWRYIYLYPTRTHTHTLNNPVATQKKSGRWAAVLRSRRRRMVVVVVVVAAAAEPCLVLPLQMRGGGGNPCLAHSLAGCCCWLPVCTSGWLLLSFRCSIFGVWLCSSLLPLLAGTHRGLALLYYICGWRPLSSAHQSGCRWKPADGGGCRRRRRSLLALSRRPLCSLSPSMSGV